MGYEYSKEDLEQMAQLGIEPTQVDEQLMRMRTGYPNANITSAVTIGSGITQVEEDEIDYYVSYFNENVRSVAKFVPASGAATRMFKKQFTYLQHPDPEVNPFDGPIENYPFSTILRNNLMVQNLDLTELERRKDYVSILHTLLDPNRMNYGHMPKALIPFHRMANGRTRRPLEEHMVEGALYAKNPDGLVDLYFTIDPEYQTEFKKIFARTQAQLEEEYKVQYTLHLSAQATNTNTIAANPDGSPYRDKQGRLVFRPAGHGALLNNLQAVTQELVFIKNIDNVIPDHLKPETIRFKKVLGGILLQTRQQIAERLERLNQRTVGKRVCKEMYEYCRKQLGWRLPVGIREAPFDMQIEYLKRNLNRPLRVCGVVRNEGEPGGGPFWVRERDGSESLQIVESAQLDVKDQRVQLILDKSKYFNPVDLVCCFQQYDSQIDSLHPKAFDLHKYVDKNTGFISSKSIDGDPILALELPGLWNGAMAHWNTIFVEVPSITFSPVKEMTDLLRAEHQPPQQPGLGDNA